MGDVTSTSNKRMGLSVVAAALQSALHSIFSSSSGQVKLLILSNLFTQAFWIHIYWLAFNDDSCPNYVQYLVLSQEPAWAEQHRTQIS